MSTDEKIVALLEDIAAGIKTLTQQQDARHASILARAAAYVAEDAMPVEPDKTTRKPGDVYTDEAGRVCEVL